MTGSVSVIICCYTEVRLNDIQDAVASVQRQSRRPEEIVLAVDNNRPLYERLQADLGGSVRVLLNENGKGLSPTRNTGVAAARGDLVAFLDDDATAEGDWLERLAALFDDPSVYAAGGRAVLAWSEGRPAWFPEEIDWAVGGSFTWLNQETTEVSNPHGHNMCFRREVFTAVGPFTPALGRSGDGGQAGEERELCLRVVHHFPQARILYEPRATIRHKVPASRGTLRYLAKRSYQEGRCKAYIQQAVRRQHTSRRHARGPLSAEQHYLGHLAFHSIPRRLVRFWRTESLAQVAAMLLCVGATGTGYVAGRWQYRASTDDARDRVPAWHAADQPDSRLSLPNGPTEVDGC